MKKFLLLPVLLLAACAPSLSTTKEPFRSGEVLVLSGTSRNGQNITEKYVLMEKPTRSGDFWYYDLEGQGPLLRMVGLVVNVDQKFIYLEDRNLDRISQERPGVTACYAYPSGPGWREANGYLVLDSLNGYKTFQEKLNKKTGDGVMSEVLGKAGTCTMTRQ